MENFLKKYEIKTENKNSKMERYIREKLGYLKRNILAGEDVSF